MLTEQKIAETSGFITTDKVLAHTFVFLDDNNMIR